MTQETLPVREKEDGQKAEFGHSLRKDFLLAPSYVNINHGSFGTYPRSVQKALRKHQDDVEARPDKWIRFQWPELLDESRAAMAEYLHAPVETLTFVNNATTGVNTVLRNLVFQPGDKIIYFATIYGACEKTVQYITETTPAEAVRIEYLHPVSHKYLVEKLREAIKTEREAGNNPRVAVFDAVVSLPGVRWPFEAMTKVCKEEGVLSLVDAAHGVGHVDIDLGELDPDFFVSNCHKWLFAPRGCAIFYVPVRNQHLMRSTLPTSWGFTPKPDPSTRKITNVLPPSAKSPYITAFQFVGTTDTAPFVCVPAALQYRASIGGEAAIKAYCTGLARRGGALVARILGTDVLENDEGTLGNCAFANVRLPLDWRRVVVDVAGAAEEQRADVVAKVITWLQAVSTSEYDTFFPVIFYADDWWVRLSAQVYLDESDFQWAGEKLKELAERVNKGEFL